MRKLKEFYEFEWLTYPGVYEAIATLKSEGIKQVGVTKEEYRVIFEFMFGQDINWDCKHVAGIELVIQPVTLEDRIVELEKFRKTQEEVNRNCVKKSEKKGWLS